MELVKKINSKKLFSEITSIPEALATSYIPSLNGLRTVSIILVLIGHCSSEYSGYFFEKISVIGVLGVYIFFVISGFLITTLLIKEKVKTGDISLTKFYKRRFLRIIPLAFLYPVVLFALNKVLHFNISFQAFACSFIFLINIPFFNRSKYLGHYWSLSVEEQFYLVFPFILKRNFKLYLYFLFSLLVLLVVLRQFDFLAMRSTHPKLYLLQRVKELVNFFDGIIIGSLLSIITFKGWIPFNFLTRFRWVINLVLCPFIIVTHCYFIHLFDPSIQSVILSVLIAIVLISNIRPANDIAFKFLNHKVISYIGTMSYSIYIWQQLFTGMVPAPFKNYFTFGNSVWFNLALLFIIAYLSFNFFEKRFLRLKSKIV